MDGILEVNTNEGYQSSPINQIAPDNDEPLVREMILEKSVRVRVRVRSMTPSQDESQNIGRDHGCKEHGKRIVKYPLYENTDSDKEGTKNDNRVEIKIEASDIETIDEIKEED